jgi:hypothetical protein
MTMKKLSIIFIFLSLASLSCSTKTNSTQNEKQETTKNPQPDKKITTPDSMEQALIIYFDYGIKNLDPLHNLEVQLDNKIMDEDLGEYDGHEIATDYSDGILYMYSADAEKLFLGIRPILDSTEFMKHAKVKIRFGPPEEGVKEKTIHL